MKRLSQLDTAPGRSLLSMVQAGSLMCVSSTLDFALHECYESTRGACSMDNLEFKAAFIVTSKVEFAILVSR